jgi:RNA polymerase sigma-70 factor, ECF subfamily
LFKEVLIMNPDKDDLINRLKNKEIAAFEELFFNYYQRLVQFASRFTNDNQVARDMVQDAFLTLWEKAESININISPKAYLFQLIRNRSLNYKRNLNIHLTIEQELALKIEDAEKATYQDFNDPYYSLIELELEQKITSTIDSLPDKCKEAFQLSRNKYLKNKEIAEIMGISSKMVEKHISKALRILRVELSDFLTLLFFI